jgi:VWFA-related protein
MGKRAGVLVALVAALGVSPTAQRQQRQPQPFPEQQQEPFPEPPPRQQPPSQQQQPPTFKSDVNAVLVDVRIVDGDGHFVPEIARDDLKIFEDGHEQTITTFERVDIPIHPDERPLFAGKPVDADVASNGGAEGRLYILLLDDYHTHTFRSPTVRALAKEFIEKNFTETDRAVVLTTSGRVKMVQEFTNNRKRLLDLVDKFEGGYEALSRCELVAATGQEQASATTHALVALDPVTETGACTVQDDRTSLEVLTGLAKWLETVSERRKAIVFISEGFDGRMSNAFDAPESDVDAYLDDLTGGSVTRSKQSDAATMISGDLKDVINSAARANVSIYAIDPNGDPNQPGTGVKPVAALADENQFDAKHLQNRLMLQALAKATGGAALTRSNDFSAVLMQAQRDSSSYYLLGFVSTNPKLDGTFRKLDVRIVGPGLGGTSVQARTGYTARNDTPPKASSRPAPSASLTALTDLMASPIQTSGLTMSVAAPAFLGKSGKASVEVVVDVAGHDLMATSASAGGKGSLELLVAVADADGHVKATERGSLDMKLTEVTRDAVAQLGLRVMSRLDVAPGRYLLKIAGVDGAGQTRGSVQYDLDVPDFSKEPLMMSGLALASTSELQRPTTGSDKDWKQRFPQPPTSARVFDAADNIQVSGEIYSNEKQIGRIETTTTVSAASGEVLVWHQETLTPAAGKPATSHHQASMSLQSLPPGSYLLTVEARNPANPKATASRQIPFAVK